MTVSKGASKTMTNTASNSAQRDQQSKKTPPLEDSIKAGERANPAIASNNITRIVAMLTVGISTLGAVIAAYQLYAGLVSTVDLWLLGIFYFSTALGIEAGFHRYFSHNAFKGNTATTWLLGIFGSMAAQGPVLFWAATHRKHHAFTDIEGDPHSPLIHGKNITGRVKGFAFAHVGWLFANELASWAKFAPDLIRRREMIKINQSYMVWVVLGLALPALLGGLIGGSWEAAFNGFIWGGLFRIFLLDHVTWSVNSICHILGSKPHKVKDNSRNLAILCIPSVGGSWHNNHHAYPLGARNDHQSKWQLDLSGMFIELLGLIGMASNIKRYQRKAGQKEQSL